MSFTRFFETLQLENRNHLTFRTSRDGIGGCKKVGSKKGIMVAASGGRMRSCNDKNPEEDKEWKGVSNNIPNSQVTKRSTKTATNNHRQPKLAAAAANPVPLIACLAALEASLPMKGRFRAISAASRNPTCTINNRRAGDSQTK
ncbi:hypothetical protein ABFS83_03G036900 [Erythranthe nasuta]